MAWGSINTAQFDEFVSHVKGEVNSSQLKKELRTGLRRVGSQALRGVKNRTPVDTGNLRRNWDIKGPFISSTLLSLEVYNGVEYAPFIEHGHRTRGGGGWVAGSHMLLKTMDEIEGQIPGLLSPMVIDALERLM